LRFGRQARRTTLRQGNTATAKDLISMAGVDRQINYIPWLDEASK